MKVVKKLSAPLISFDGIEKTKEVIVNDELRKPLADLPEFDGLILKPIPITEAQSVFLSSRSYTFFIVSYLPRSVLQFACERCGTQHFAFIEHNKDITSDGILKKPHFHVLLHFSSLETFSRLVYWFRSLEIRQISTDNVSNEWNYLTHNSDKCRKEHKVPYSENEIVSNDLSYWKSRCYSICSDDNVALSMFDDYCSGDFSTRDMIVKYGFKFFTYKRVLDDLKFSFIQFNAQNKPVLVNYGNTIVSNLPEFDGIKVR